MVFKANCSETMFPMILEAFLKGSPRQKKSKMEHPIPEMKVNEEISGALEWIVLCVSLLWRFPKKSKMESPLPWCYSYVLFLCLRGFLLFPFVFLHFCDFRKNPKWVHPCLCTIFYFLFLCVRDFLLFSFVSSFWIFSKKIQNG